MKRLASIACCLLLFAGPAWAIGERIGKGVKMGKGSRNVPFTSVPTPTPTPTATPTNTPTPGDTPTPTPTPTPLTGSSAPISWVQQATHDGWFKVPNGTFGADKFDGLECGNNLAFNPSGDGGNGSLFIVGNDQDSVAEISLAVPKIDTLANLNRATILQNFTDISNGAIPQSTNCTSVGHQCQADIEIFGGDLWSVRWEFYSPQDADDTIFRSSYPTLGTFGTGFAGLDAGAGHVPAGQHSRALFALPSAWRTLLGFDMCTMRFRSQAGCFGPCTYCFVADPPTNGTDLTALKLIHYPTEPSLLRHNSVSQYNDAAWLTAGSFEALAVGGLQSAWEYYKHSTRHDCGGQAQSKCGGYCGVPYLASLWLYAPDDVLKVKNGTLAPNAIMPYDQINLESYMYPRADDDRCRERIQGMAFDATNRRLYLIQGMGNTETASRCLVGRWTLATTQTGSPDTQSPTTPTNFTCTPGTGQCSCSWTASTDDSPGIVYRLRRNRITDGCTDLNPDPAGCPRWNQVTDFQYIARTRGATSYVDTIDITAGQQHTYEVEAVDLYFKTSARASTTCTPN